MIDEWMNFIMESIDRRTEIARTFGYKKNVANHTMNSFRAMPMIERTNKRFSFPFLPPGEWRCFTSIATLQLMAAGSTNSVRCQSRIHCHTLYFIVYTPTAANAKLKFTQDKMPLILSTCICRRTVYSPPVICVMQMPSPATEKCRPNWKTTTPTLAYGDGFPSHSFGCVHSAHYADWLLCRM